MSVRARLPAAPEPVLETGLVVAWSSGFIGAVLASDTQSVYLVLFWRFALLAALLLPFALPALRRASRRVLMRQAVIGALAMFGYLTAVNVAIDLGVPAGTVALIAALQPLATAALAGIVLGETVVPRQWLGLAIGFGGVALAAGGSVGTASLPGYALAFISMAALVAATLASKAARVGLSLVPTLCLQSAVSAALVLPLAVTDRADLATGITPAFAVAVLWQTVFATLGAYGLYWATLARTTATRVGSLIYMTPPVTALWAFAMFGQPITAAHVAGFVVCLAGVALASGSSLGMRPKARARLPAPPRP